MKKTVLRVVLIIAGVVLLMFILTYGAFYIRDLAFRPYNNDSWQTIDFFDKGSIQIPPDWTYTTAENEIILIDPEGEAVIYISDDEDYSAPGFVSEKDSEFEDRHNNIMGTGMYRASAMIEIYSDKNTGDTYYLGELYKRDTFTAVKASHSFGFFFAQTKDISIEEFTNILTSYKK